jgi:hypothetical protein
VTATRRHHNDDDVFYFVERIRNASKPEIARLLLTIPDGIVGSHGEQLRAACRYEQFPEGANFLLMRATAFDAVRTAEGKLPRGASEPLERWRAAMVEFSRSAAA